VEAGAKGTIVLHHVPESEGFEGGFEAVTLSGAPHDVYNGQRPGFCRGWVESPS
jgi:hypothetical protein